MSWLQDDLDRAVLLLLKLNATVIRQAALGAGDREALAAADACLEQTARQAKWLKTRIKTHGPTGPNCRMMPQIEARFAWARCRPVHSSLRRARRPRPPRDRAILRPGFQAAPT